MNEGGRNARVSEERRLEMSSGGGFQRSGLVALGFRHVF